MPLAIPRRTAAERASQPSARADGAGLGVSPKLPETVCVADASRARREFREKRLGWGPNAMNNRWQSTATAAEGAASVQGEEAIGSHIAYAPVHAAGSCDDA